MSTDGHIIDSDDPLATPCWCGDVHARAVSGGTLRERVADALARKRGYVNGASVAEHYEDADAALAAVTSAPGLEEALAAEARRHGHDHLADVWTCLCGTPLPAAGVMDAPYSRRLSNHTAEAQADVVRAWLR